MVVMYRMSSEKKEKMLKKINKMMDFLDEFKYCLENSEEEYRGNYRKDWEEEDDEPKHRYRYSR